MRLLLLTGGSRGIGLAVSEVFASAGFTVIEFSRTAPHSYSVAVDFASPLEAHRCFEDSWARIDVRQLEDLFVISNAATLEPIGPACGKSPASILENLNVNIVAPILFMSAVISKFQDAPCRKVLANMSAGATQRGVFGWSLYCAAKVAAENFIRSIAIEQQAQSHPFVAVNVDPGVVDTDMHSLAAAAPLNEFPAASEFAARKARGQLTPPQQSASAVAKILLSARLVAGKTYDARDVQA